MSFYSKCAKMALQTRKVGFLDADNWYLKCLKNPVAVVELAVPTKRKIVLPSRMWDCQMVFPLGQNR